MNVSNDELVELLEMLKDTDFSEFELRVGDLNISVKRGATSQHTATETPQAGTPSAPEIESASKEQAAPSVADVPDVPEAPAPSVVADQPRELRANEYVITAPMSGVVYLQPDPTADRFVEVGSSVSDGTPVAILEVMKLFQTITATEPGVVRAVLVEDGALVESGQEIFVVERSAAAS